MAFVDAPVELSVAHHLDQIQAAANEALAALEKLDPSPEQPSTARISQSLTDRARNIEEDVRTITSRLSMLVNRAGAAI